MATITQDSTYVEPTHNKHVGEPDAAEKRHLQLDRTFITKPSSPGSSVNDEERSLLITFVAFAIIVAISALAVMAMVNEGGSGSVTTFAEGMQTAITPNIQT